jgi:hypothetical protein
MWTDSLLYELRWAVCVLVVPLGVIWGLPVVLFTMPLLLILIPITHVLSFIERRAISIWICVNILLHLAAAIDIATDTILLFTDLITHQSINANNHTPYAKQLYSNKITLTIHSLRLFYTILASAISLFTGKLLYAFVIHDASKTFQPMTVFKTSFLRNPLWTCAMLSCIFWKLPLMLMRFFMLGILTYSVSRKHGERLMYSLSHTIDLLDVLHLNDFILSSIPLLWLSIIELYRAGFPENGEMPQLTFLLFLRLMKVGSCLLSSIRVYEFLYFNVLGYSGRGFGQRIRRYESEYSHEKDNFTDKSSYIISSNHKHQNHHRMETNLTLTWSDQHEEDTIIVRAQKSPTAGTQKSGEKMVKVLPEIQETIPENEPLIA